MKKIYFYFAFVLSIVYSVPAKAQLPTGHLGLIKAEWELDKKILLADIMEFEQQEAIAFWPLYDTYMKDWCKLINDRTSKLTAYCDNFKKTTNSTDLQFTDQLFVNDIELNRLQKKTYKKMRKVIPLDKANRFMQLEYTFQLALLNEMQQRAVVMSDLVKKL